MTSRWFRHMPHTLTVSTPAEIDRHGAVSDYGDARAIACRIEPRSVAWYGADPSVSVVARIYADGAAEAPLVGDRAELSGLWSGEYVVKRVEPKCGLEGSVDHYVVWVG